MTRLPAIWLLCLGLVLTQLLGLHAHACSDTDNAGHRVESVHYADAGFLFGEFHSNDHQDNFELELMALPSIAKVKNVLVDADNGTALPASDLKPVFAVVWLVAHAFSSSPTVHETRFAHLLPPLRGPPSSSFV